MIRPCTPATGAFYDEGGFYYREHRVTRDCSALSASAAVKSEVYLAFSPVSSYAFTTGMNIRNPSFSSTT